MKFLLLLLLTMFCFTKTTLAQSYQVLVPYDTEAPQIDGRMNTNEWANAHIAALPDSGEVLFLHDMRHLYVALRLHKRGIGSLCIQNNDRVRILHASAALGTAVYIQNEGGWELKESFQFISQKTDSSRIQKRADFLANHGWVASTVSMEGDETVTFLEYKIRLNLFDTARPTLGVAGMLLEPNQKFIHLPATLDDGCSSPKLIRGFPPEKIQFNPPGWLHLAIRN